MQSSSLKYLVVLVSKVWLLSVLTACLAPARGEEIAAVLERSQATRLASFQSPASQDERAGIVRRSFAELAQRLDSRVAVELRVVTGSVVAECLLGHVIVANESLADLQEPVRLFLLAHELGHAVLGHWQQTSRLYSTHMPGQMESARLQPASEEFLFEASRLSQAHELEADAFAYRLLRALGYDFPDMIGALTAFGMQRDTATHPGTGKRIAHLRSLG
jgi:Zn-dependent protease with chaperone function